MDKYFLRCVHAGMENMYLDDYGGWTSNPDLYKIVSPESAEVFVKLYPVEIVQANP